MALSGVAVQKLYTRRADHCSAFIGAFQSPRGFQALLKRSPLLRPGLRVLDAGCGSGKATLVLLEALRQNHFDYKKVDAFDLTPALLDRFQRVVDALGITGVRLCQADVLALEALPSSWTDYDLILSVSMLEYLPKEELSRALGGLRARLAPGGNMLVVITRKAPETKVLIEWLWHAERYTKKELLLAFTKAGFRDPTFLTFPWPYFWLNRASYVVAASN